MDSGFMAPSAAQDSAEEVVSFASQRRHKQNPDLDRAVNSEKKCVLSRSLRAILSICQLSFTQRLSSISLVHAKIESSE